MDAVALHNGFVCREAINRLSTCPKVRRRPRRRGEQHVLWVLVLPTLCWDSPRLPTAEPAVGTAQDLDVWLMVQETHQNPLDEATDP